MKLQNILNDRGISTKVFAEKTGIPEFRIREYLSGKRKPSEKTMYVIAKNLCVPVEDLT